MTGDPTATGLRAHPAGAGGEGRRGAMPPAGWHILTGEYPPRPGGVADYSHLVAAGLARSGAAVRVWTGPAEGPTPEAAGVVVDRRAGRWGPADLARLDAALDACPSPRRLLVQYAPNVWGYRGVNLGFCRWLVRRRRRGDDVWAMIHEAFYGWYLRDRPTRWALAAAHRLMIRSLLAASSRVFLSMPGLERRLRPYEPGPRRPMTWLPVPSNVPAVEDAAAVAATRRRVAPRGELVVGHFGTFGPSYRHLLAAALPPLLEDRPDRVGLLIGRGGGPFAAELAAAHPGLAGRLVATGGLAPEAASLHLQACDVLVQPYDDGVSTRRGSAMAGLAHGRPIATTRGRHTDPTWSAAGCVSLVAPDDPAALARAAEALLADPDARDRLGAAARAAYDRHFALERTIEAMLAPDRAGTR
jgi:glycosyltransferase involved in cell wall biosynthesis